MCNIPRHATCQAVICRPFNTEGRVRYQSIPYESFGGSNDIGTFPASTYIFPCHYPPTTAPHIFSHCSFTDAI